VEVEQKDKSHYIYLWSFIVILMYIILLKTLRFDQISCSKTVFPNLFLASALFSDKEISIAPLPCLAHISTQFIGIAYLGCLKMIKTGMNAKMHFIIKLNLVN